MSSSTKEIDRLRRDLKDQRRALIASVTANTVYEVMEAEYLALVKAGRDWIRGGDACSRCGSCGDCPTCILATLIQEAGLL